MISVVVADDHPLFRDGIRRLLENDPGIEVAGEAATGPEAIEVVRKTRPQVVLLDVSMPGRGGLETLRELKERDPEVRVLILTVHPEDQFAVRCLKAGADGYLTKTALPQVLVSAIRRVAEGHKYITAEVAELLVISVSQDFEGPPHEILSDREFQVMRMIGEGKTVSEIGKELHLSVKTISTYRSHILEKMNLRNNAEIMKYVITGGLGERSD